eukprot:TRINITY_DN6496_c0_g3_i1.p1 TRINITY_DN6496_c0_g3~~TRINITY_DN6496_c0_g3_i1.p1  ORF type:complete len:282 (-),score=62.95 TRINITY_DN6496_c0_g3_i1:126-971(-)
MMLTTKRLCQGGGISVNVVHNSFRTCILSTLVRKQPNRLNYSTSAITFTSTNDIPFSNNPTPINNANHTDTTANTTSTNATFETNPQSFNHNITLPLNSPLFDRPDVREFLSGVIRVDHAGEVGAARIYAGQLAVLKGTPEEPIIQEMADQEIEHQETFHRLINNHRVRPTVLSPIWNVLGWGLGAGSALLGKEAAMAVTVAVETVIGEHYNDQLRQMNDLNLTGPEYQQLRDVIKKFRDDELHHLQIGLDHNAEQAPFYSVLQEAVKAGTRAAVYLSTRI